MVFPDSRYSFRVPSRNKRGRGRKTLIVLVLVAALGAVVFWRWDELVGVEEVAHADPMTIEELWDAGAYEQVAARTETLLASDPMDVRALVYRGFSHFYLAVGLFSMEERLPHIDQAIVSLRKARLHGLPSLRGSIDYVLGKAYHFKGRLYADLTIRYLLSSLDVGYIADDTYEYLGLAFSELADYEKSAEFFLKAVEQDPTDIRYLALSQAYINAGSWEAAEEYLVRTLGTTADPEIEQKTRFLLGKLYTEAGQLAKAEEQYLKIQALNPGSADAYYYLGEVYYLYGETKLVEARAQWRRAYQVDRNHYGARLRLF